MAGKVIYIDEADIKNKKVLLRVDFDVSLNPDSTIANDVRIQQNLPTIKYLLKNKNKLICVAKLGRPKSRDLKFSLKIVIDRLRQYIPDYQITLINDFLTADKEIFNKQTDKEIFVLENIRFYPEEKKGDPEFAKKLASLGDVYVNDAFAMCHRLEASVVGVTRYLPSYGGLLLKEETSTILAAINNPRRPLITIIGGAKVSTKINLLKKLVKMADFVLVGGGLANTFLAAKGYGIGQSYYESDQLENAKEILSLSNNLILPSDAIIGNSEDKLSEVKKIDQIPKDVSILDIGPETQAIFGDIIAKAKTIIWNGPVGYFENSTFRRGTDFIYYAVAHNPIAVSIVGGGDTLAAISKKEYLDKITHLSTGGGAMLELIEKGTLPGIEALKEHAYS